MKALRRYRPSYVFTFEGGWASFLIATLQSLGFMRSSTKHVILQFIMREKDDSLKSKIKYQIMQFIFSSVYTVVCSSMDEMVYYQKAFKWNRDKTRFVPCYFNPEHLSLPHDEGEGFILTAGRTFRDYDTFFNAVRGIGYRVIVVASRWNIDAASLPENVSVKYDISMDDLTELIRKSSVVVVPLEDRKISIGQSVFLQAMAMGKAVVVTRTSGTVDYIDHLKNGILVPPGDSIEMRKAILYLMENSEERTRMGKNARHYVTSSCLPKHYFNNVKKLLCRQENE